MGTDLFRKCVSLPIILAVFFVFSPAIWAEDSPDSVRVNVGVMPKLSATYRANGIAVLHGARKILENGSINVTTYSVPGNRHDAFRSALLASGEAAFVERDMLRAIPVGEQAVKVEFSPDDPEYLEQWAPRCIGAERAWEYEKLTGRPEVIVAVIDTGIDYTHPDLVASVDMSIDYDFVNDDEDAMDDNGHGTHCAGIIAAGFNNTVGVAGLQNVTLMAVKGLNAKGVGWDSILARSITYATDHGAKILSCSWGSFISTKTLENAVSYAIGKGVIVVAAAGNAGVQWKFYPAAYPQVIGVAALEDCDTVASYSNYGSRNVFISAPGSNIVSTFPNNSYALMSGTSMACPHVAAIAAMWLSASLDYVNLTPWQVMLLLASTADDLGEPGKDLCYGYGRVNMFPWNK
jgi:subtilisin family serine protease